MKLKKYIKYYDTGEIHFICLKDEKGKAQGEYIDYHKDGSIYSKGFFKDNWCIGKYYYQEEYHFHSFINIVYKQISEQEHKKELAMVRLGLIDYPIQLSYLLKDYNETGKII
jgi:hypothetical protein